MNDAWAPGGANEWPPVLGEDVTMPSGAVVRVYSWSQDHSGRRVNDVTVWEPPTDVPPPAAPILVYPPEVERVDAS